MDDEVLFTSSCRDFLLSRLDVSDHGGWIGARLRDVRLAVPEPSHQQAAVLVAMQPRGRQVGFVLTRRTELVATHKGEICFPGGVREAGDADLVQTALRECEEEIGVAQRCVRVLGEFRDFADIYGQTVRAVAAWLPEKVRFRPGPEEVAAVLWIPVEFFIVHPPRVEFRKRQGRNHPVYHFDFAGEHVWGLTARIIVEFLTFLAE